MDPDVDLQSIKKATLHVTDSLKDNPLPQNDNFLCAEEPTAITKGNEYSHTNTPTAPCQEIVPCYRVSTGN